MKPKIRCQKVVTVVKRISKPYEPVSVYDVYQAMLDNDCHINRFEVRETLERATERGLISKVGSRFSPNPNVSLRDHITNPFTQNSTQKRMKHNRSPNLKLTKAQQKKPKGRTSEVRKKKAPVRNKSYPSNSHRSIKDVKYILQQKCESSTVNRLENVPRIGANLEAAMKYINELSRSDNNILFKAISAMYVPMCFYTHLKIRGIL